MGQYKRPKQIATEAGSASKGDRRGEQSIAGICARGRCRGRGEGRGRGARTHTHTHTCEVLVPEARLAATCTDVSDANRAPEQRAQRGGDPEHLAPALHHAAVHLHCWARRTAQWPHFPRAAGRHRAAAAAAAAAAACAGALVRTAALLLLGFVGSAGNAGLTAPARVGLPALVGGVLAVALVRAAGGTGRHRSQ